jgi:hypothetical protein
MKKKYAMWVAANVTGDGLGRCAEITQQMAKAFPELRRERGHYLCHTWGEREHWWLLDPEDHIVDPTAAQFPSRGTGMYIPWEEGQEEPTGRCLNCGEYCYGQRTFCSSACENAAVSEFNQQLR